MILLVTNEQDFTADRVLRELDGRGVPVVRLNTEQFPTGVRCRYRMGEDGLTASLDVGYGRHVVPDDVTAVWYRRPEPALIDPAVTDPVARRFARREAGAALRGFLGLCAPARWVNRPEANWSAEDKMVQLVLARQVGFEVPRTLVTNDPAEAERFCADTGADVVAKTVGPAFIAPDGRTQVYTSRVRPAHLELVADVAYAPLILQQRVDKRLEVRVTVVGSRVLAAAIDSQASPVTSDDWRRDVFRAPHHVHELPDDVADRCRRLVHRFGLLFGALDLVLTPDGRYVFLEINPNGEWDWIEAMTGLPIAAALADLLTGLADAPGGAGATVPAGNVNRARAGRAAGRAATRRFRKLGP